MPTFVTGGSGFIGTHLVKKLVQRGWQVRALARSDESAEIVAGLGAEVVRGDVSDSQAMLEGMRGCDKVLHVAGVYSTDMQKQNQLIPVNVRGTETVRRAALQTGVERIIYASSIVVLGHTNGMVVDQTYYHRPPWQTQYERSKWLAHRFHTPVFMHPDSLRLLGVTYIASDAKAKSELGWCPRSLREGLPNVIQDLED